MTHVFNGVAARPSPSIATKAELDARLAARPTPEATSHLRPGGPSEASVHRTVNQTAEHRIAELRTRLEAARNGLERDHAFGLAQGRAGNDFERSR